MKKSLKLICLMLAFIMLLSVAMTSCNDTAPDDSETNQPGTDQPGTDQPGTDEDDDPDSQPDYVMPEDEYRLPLEDGYNQLTLYWAYNGPYESCDIWIWWGDVAGKGYVFHECNYGAKVVVNVPEGVDQVGFIVRKNCSEPGGSSWGNATKDYDQDRFAVIDGKETVIYLKTGDASQYSSNDGGKTLQMIKKFSLAGIVDEKKIQYTVTPKVKISSLDQVKVYDGDREIKVTSLSTLGREATAGYIEVEETLDLSANYRVSIEGYGSKTAVPTSIFDSKFFADQYHYDGNDLGAVIHGDNTTFKVWAPTASKVLLNLFAAGNGEEAYKTVEMVKGDKGVWSHTEACGHGTYYTYTVTTSMGTQEAVDPYAKAAGVNGNRGMVVDLSQTNPDGWKGTDFKTGIKSYSSIQ